MYVCLCECLCAKRSPLKGDVARRKARPNRLTAAVAADVAAAGAQLSQPLTHSLSQAHALASS